MKLKNYVFFILKLTLAAGLIFYLYQSGNFTIEKLQQLTRIDIILIGLAIVGFVLFAASARFRTLSTAPLSALQSWKLTLMGVFFNFFVPGGVGGDLVKGVVMHKNMASTPTSAAFTVLMDRVLGLATMSLLSVVAFLFVPEHLRASSNLQLLAIFLVLLFVSILVGLSLLISSRARQIVIFKILPIVPAWVEKKFLFFHEKQKEKSYSLRTLLRASFWSMCSQVGSILLFFIVGEMIFTELVVTLPIYFFVVPIGFMLTAVPISPGGIGVGQAAFLFLFQRAMGVPTEIGVIAITGFQFYQFIWGLLGIYYFVFSKKNH